LKHIYRRLAALALVLLLALTGCAPAEQKEEALTLADNGVTEFRVVYGAGCTQQTVDAASVLQKEIERLTGASLSGGEDLATTPTADSWEILLGSCDRSEDDTVYAALRSIADYRVQVQGRKLVIAATRDDSLLAAVQALCLVLGDYTENGKMVLPADFLLTGGADGEGEPGIPVFAGGTLRAGVDGGNGTELLIYSADSKDCDAYLKALDGAGYALHAQHEIDGNRYFTCVGNGATVTVMDTPAMGAVRVSVDPAEYLLPTQPEKTDAVVQPSVTLLGLEGYNTNSAPTQTGLSMLYQLSDGRFIVVDGGHNKIQASGPIYKTMAKLAPDPDNITVAAWLVTHSHNDHAGAFISFCRNYGKKVTVEKVLVNFPGDGQYTSSSTGTSYKENVLAEAEKLSGTQIIKVHPGQVFYLGDAVMEILYTLDLYEPDRLVDFNDSSIVCSITLGGQRMLVTGDCGVLSSNILCRLYDGALRSDIVQMSHHGYQGATEELYRAVDPLYVLWPSGSTTYERYKTASNNTWLLQESHMERLWLAEDKIQTLPLPIGG